MDLSIGWVTDLAVLGLGGSLIRDRGDHLLVTTPDNPGYHWGTFVLVTDPSARDEAERWVAVFRQAFPAAGHLAIGLPAEPDPIPWTAVGLVVESEDVLSTGGRPALRPAPAGYGIQPLSTPAGWQAAVQAEIDENTRAGGHPAPAYRRFVTRQSATRQALVGDGAAAFFGAFVAGRCVAQLGIVLCGRDEQGALVARYQGVLTDAEHRGRGLAGHLVGRAATWAQARGASRWVIVAEPGSVAGRLYSRLGFRAETRTWQAVRPGAGEPGEPGPPTGAPHQ